MTTDAVSERPASSVEGRATTLESLDGIPISDLESGDKEDCQSFGRFFNINLTLSSKEKASACPFEIISTFVPSLNVNNHAAYAADVHEKPNCLAFNTVTSLFSTRLLAKSTR